MIFDCGSWLLIRQDQLLKMSEKLQEMGQFNRALFRVFFWHIYIYIYTICTAYLYIIYIYRYLYILYNYIYIYIYIVKSRVILLLNICYVMNLVGCGGFREIQSELLDFTKHVWHGWSRWSQWSVLEEICSLVQLTIFCYKPALRCIEYISLKCVLRNKWQGIKDWPWNKGVCLPDRT